MMARAKYGYNLAAEKDRLATKIDKKGLNKPPPQPMPAAKVKADWIG